MSEERISEEVVSSTVDADGNTVEVKVVITKPEEEPVNTTKKKEKAVKLTKEEKLALERQARIDDYNRRLPIAQVLNTSEVAECAIIRGNESNSKIWLVNDDNTKLALDSLKADNVEGAAEVVEDEVGIDIMPILRANNLAYAGLSGFVIRA